MTTVVGTAKMRPLDSVQPNPWNPNRMSDRMRESLKQGLTADGWIASQALLILGTDAKGKKRDIIIDGEHRWRMARELGFKEGPMVVVDGLTDAQAKALTIKMNQKRGEFDSDLLAGVVQDINLESGLDVEELSLDLGLTEDALMEYLVPDEPSAAEPKAVDVPRGEQPNQRVALEFLVTEQQAPAIREFFKHASLKTELNNEKFLRIVQAAMAEEGVDG